MRVTASVFAGVVAAVLSVVAAAPAQQPKVTNAQVSVRNGANLQQEIAAVKTPTWIGYTVPLQRALRTNYDDSVAHLEGNPRHDEIVSEPKPGDPAARGNVLLRVDGGAIQKVRIEEVDREIDGGALPFVWLTDVRPDDSVKTIAAAIDAGVSSNSHLPLESGLLVIALEDAPEALPALRGFT